MKINALLDPYTAPSKTSRIIKFEKPLPSSLALVYNIQNPCTATAVSCDGGANRLHVYCVTWLAERVTASCIDKRSRRANENRIGFEWRLRCYLSQCPRRPIPAECVPRRGVITQCNNNSNGRKRSCGATISIAVIKRI